MPGPAGGSWMALSPIWPITQAGPRCFQRDPGSNLTQDCLHRGQRLSGQERPISCWPLRDRHINSELWPPPPPHPPPLYPPTPPTLSMFSAQDSRGLLTGYEPWPWETAWGGSSSRRFRTNQLLIYEVNMKLDKYCDSLSTFSLQDVSSPPNWFI